MYNYVQHKFENGFPLSNCVLYYLNWYYRSDNIWEDIRKCIIADGYCGEHMSKYDMFRLIIGMADDWNLYAANNGYKLISVSKVLLPEWKMEGWKKFDKEQPLLLGMLWEILGEFALGYDREHLPLKKPHFSKKNPLKPRRYLEGETYTTANRRVESFKNWK